MTAEAWVFALCAYLLSGTVVALWLWPVRSTDSGGDEIVRGLVFIGWPGALLAVCLMALLRGLGRTVAWCARGRRP